MMTTATTYSSAFVSNGDDGRHGGNNKAEENSYQDVETQVGIVSSSTTTTSYNNSSPTTTTRTTKKEVAPPTSTTSTQQLDSKDVKNSIQKLQRFREMKTIDMENAQRALDSHNSNVLDSARLRVERAEKKMNEPLKNAYIPGRKRRVEKELKLAKMELTKARERAEDLAEKLRICENEFEKAWETSPLEKQMIRDLAHDVALLLNENRMGFGCGKFMDYFLGFAFIAPLLWTAGMVFSAMAFVYFIVGRITRPCRSSKRSNYSGWWFREAKSRAGKTIFRWIALEQILDRILLLSRSPRIIANILELRPVARRAKKMCAPAADSIYLISEEVMRTCNGFPKFEDAIQRGLLTKIPVEFLRNPSKAKVLFHPKADIVFVSHKWFGMDPDPSHQVYERVKRMNKTQDKFENFVNDDLSWVGQAYKRVEGKPYVWFDYTCVPQNKEDENKRARFLRTIPAIVVHSGFSRVHGYVELQNQYESSIWCMLESILATYPPLFRPLSPEKDRHFFKNKEKTEWTIADKSDLYQVLPGFLYYLCSNLDLLISLLTEKARRKTVVSILEMFVHFHDEHKTSLSSSNVTTSDAMILQPSQLPSLTSLSSPPSPGGGTAATPTAQVIPQVAPAAPTVLPEDGIQYAVVVPAPFDYMYKHPSPFSAQ